MSEQVITDSCEVVIKTMVIKDGYKCTVASVASFMVEGEQREATSAREIDLFKAEYSKTSTEEFIEATKRETLRDLVTNLNVYKVL